MPLMAAAYVTLSSLLLGDKQFFHGKKYLHRLPFLETKGLQLSSMKYPRNQEAFQSHASCVQQQGYSIMSTWSPAEGLALAHTKSY